MRTWLDEQRAIWEVPARPVRRIRDEADEGMRHMMPDLDANTDLSFTRTLAVPRQLVWDCWTKPEHIPHFFVLVPHRVTKRGYRPSGRRAVQHDLRGRKQGDGQSRRLSGVGGSRDARLHRCLYGGLETRARPVHDRDPAPGGCALAAARPTRRSPGTGTPKARKVHEDMGFYDGWGTVATQLEAYAKGLL